MKTNRILIVILFALALGACGNGLESAEPTAISSSTRAAPTNTPSPISVGQTPALAPGASVDNLPYEETTASSTPTLSLVTVTAVKGNVFIRRGPDLAYNAVSVLMDGQSANAVARDVLGNWLQISLPEDSRETGWISIQSRYTVVSGKVMDLPEVIPTDWPVQAHLRNCTFHQMEVRPGEIVIPSIGSFPANDVQINPGVYTVHDIEVDGSPEVMGIEIKEGSAIDILDDGEGNHKKCSIP